MMQSLRQLLRRPAREEQPRPDWKRQGNDFLAQGNLAEATRCYREAVAADAQDAAARLNLGFVLLEQQSLAEARRWLEEALRLQPAQHDAHFLLARAARSEGRLESAAQGYAEAVRHEPTFELARVEGCEVCIELGQREQRAGRPEAARRWFADAAQRQPGNVTALANLGLACETLVEMDAAAAAYGQALALDPAHSQSLVGMGNVFMHRKDPAAAAGYYQQVVDRLPDLPMARVNLGTALQNQGRLDEALQSFRRALELQPGYVEAMVNVAGTLMAQNRTADAIAVCDEALQHDPGNAAARWNRSLCQLLQGDFEAGWPEAEWRWDALGRKRFATSRPQWTGAEPLAGKTILVHSEQGLGDTLQFCRYVPMLAQRGAEVVLGVQQPLEGLLQTLAGPFRLIGTGEGIPEHDYHCPLLSLPLGFGTRLDTIPAAVPYLASRPERVAQWRQRLPATGARRIGIAWSGNPGHVNDRNRSMSLQQLLQVAGEGVQLFSMQKEVRAADAAVLREAAVPHFGELLEDFEDTAALVECMDLVISVDTSIAHLAGALGKPVWILLPFSPDWRWLLHRDDSPWYPNVRLFRQDASREWGPVLGRVRAELDAMVAAGPTAPA